MSQATQLCDRYLSHSKYLYAAIPRTELYDDILAAVYQAHSYESFQVHHSMALLFIIFALALHFDSQGGDAEYYRQREAAGYYQLARTTLGFASPVRETTVASIQTLIHMAQYLDLCDWESSGSASSWLYVGQAVRLGLSMGLNLNPARWRLPESDTNKRKRVFWQLFVSDTWTSFYFGRPPSISPNYIDCPVPDGIELAKQAAASSTAASTSTTGFEHSTGSHTDFQTWIYRFTTLMHFVMSSGMGPKQPASYSAILDLDRQIRDFPVPAVWRTAVVGSPDEREQQAITTETYFHRWAVLASQETILLNLHRAYFAQALYENSHDLQEHRYIPSVVAIYRSSWRIVTGLQLTWERASDVIQRVNLPWSQALSAAIVMCLLITRAPSSHLVTPALDKLGQLVGLFHAASPSCRFAENLLPTIQRLHNKACESVNPPLPRYQPTAPAYESSITQAELDRLSGRTYLFSEADSSAHIGSSSPTTSSPHLTSSPSSSISCGPAQMQRGEDKPRRPSSRSSGKSSTTAASTGTPSSSLNLDSLHQVLVEDLKDYGRRATVPTVQTLNDGVVGSGSRGTSPQSTPTDAGVRNGSPGGSRSSDYMSSRGSGHHAGHPPSSAPPSMSTTSSTSMDPIVGHHLPPSHHGHHLVPASQYQQQQQQQQQPPYYSSGGHVSATGHMPLAPPPPPPIHHPPPAYLPPSGGHQGVPHHSMTRPPSMDTVPPFPGTDPTYGVYNSNGVTPPANGDRKYATLTNCMPGFNPTIEGLDASWQSLVEQLGY
ncbi:hypothetical protein CC1G_13783 [Coprinopsis cinerea okayama7|uniref:Xylanolytic transcriptional activator regulatory domain-containing protein n=1 Tax=Coprinopsis cinerea (strain Okayama-7 / 130 / ATCC MYA-4618 / FGSC 9003) TaxID=240176 RepID=D6RK90_COPC7|nr:hypothetical protein CC1G_13783 [Coprinopsis cinerea okayama7\|eukprot:XP_002912251.1 hypothetical protein CC1G_13783 [Coprinopsis cinerea okayama7\